MKTTVFVLLLAVALGACAPAATPAPAPTPISPTVIPPTIMPTVAVPPAPMSTATAAAPDPQQLSADLDAMLQKFTEEQHFRGSVLVAQNGQVILSKGYGLADREKKIPNTAQTRFLIGTITKQFTAMAILMLQEQGKLNVQDKICKYLPGCPDAWKPITLHQLLTQTSGIPDRTDVYFYRSITSTVPLEQMIADVKTLPLDFQPGEKFSDDDGVDYTLLGKIIEAVSGQSYGAFLQKNIFEPLQMSNTGYDPNRTDLAIGGSNGIDAAAAPQLNMWFMFSAAGLYSTVEDLYRWDQALYTDKLVPQKVLDTMFTSYVPSERDGYGFGYGWYIGLDKQRVVKTPGNIIGFDGTLRRYLNDKATIIYLTNQDDYDNKVIADSIAMKLFGFVGK